MSDKDHYTHIHRMERYARVSAMMKTLLMAYGTETEKMLRGADNDGTQLFEDLLAEKAARLVDAAARVTFKD